MTASVALTRYVEPPPEQRVGMPRGSYHARLATEIESTFAQRCAHQVGARHYFVEVCCPDCGVVMMLSRENHTVAADGVISPSLVCSNTRKACAWHVWARLDEWPPR